MARFSVSICAYRCSVGVNALEALALEVLFEEDTLPVHVVMSHTAQSLLFLDKKIVTLVQISGATLSFPVLCHGHSHPSENQYLFRAACGLET